MSFFTVRARMGSEGHFNKPGWAWEYLRRNADFGVVWHRSRQLFEVVAESPDRKVVIVHTKSNPLGPWGCLFSDAPNEGAATATVFWEPENFRGALSGIALAPEVGFSASSFHLDKVPCPIAVLLMPGGRQHVLLLGKGRRLQLVIDGVDIRAPFHFFTHTMLEGSRSRAQTSTLQCFNELLHQNRFVSSHYLTDPPPPRLNFMVKALDGWLARKPHKDIAVTLFGAKRVADDWYDPFDHLRDRVRRAVREGKRLMAGRYLKLLQ